MPTFYYKARDRFGRLVSGSVEIDSETALATKLKQLGYLPVDIKKTKEVSALNRFSLFKRVKFSDLNMFTRQFYALQKAGLPVVSSLNALRDQSSSAVLKHALGQIIKDIEGGLSLSMALERHPLIFNALYINMIKAGEASGTLDENLGRLADLGESEEKTRLQIKSATRYPIIVVICMIVAFLILTTFVVPRFAKLYTQFKAKLPLVTRGLIGLNLVITKYWWLIVIIVGFIIFLFNRFINTKLGRLWWDNLKLRVPVFGPLVLKLTMSRFTRITATLMRSGVPILNTLELARDGTGNVIIAMTIDNIKKSVNEGKGMVEPMKKSGLFPPIVIQMVAMGEETGKIDELLLNAADYYDSQVSYTINNLVTLIDPILIFIIGCGVLTMALGIFLPLWNLITLFRR